MKAFAGRIVIAVGIGIGNPLRSMFCLDSVDWEGVKAASKHVRMRKEQVMGYLHVRSKFNVRLHHLL